jgi:uncharacterized protein (TIGR04255 family)
MQNKDIKAGFEYFNKAPIILSIIQFRYSKIEEFDNEAFKKLGEKLKKEYPYIKERFIQAIHISESPKEPTHVSLDEKVIDGIQFVSEDKKKVLIIGRDKFTFEVHGNYKGWEEFTKEAKYLWEFFQGELKNLNLKGLSIRYVNKFNLPSQTKNISDYFTTFITSSEGDYDLSGFQFRYTTFLEKENIVYHVGHALESIIDDKFPYLFDIDVIYLKDLSNESNQIWDIFERLREKKNVIFNSGLTDKAKNLIR